MKRNRRMIGLLLAVLTVLAAFPPPPSLKGRWIRARSISADRQDAQQPVVDLVADFSIAEAEDPV